MHYINPSYVCLRCLGQREGRWWWEVLGWLDLDPRKWWQIIFPLWHSLQVGSGTSADILWWSSSFRRYESRFFSLGPSAQHKPTIEVRHSVDCRALSPRLLHVGLSWGPAVLTIWLPAFFMIDKMYKSYHFCSTVLRTNWKHMHANTRIPICLRNWIYASDFCQFVPTHKSAGMAMVGGIIFWSRVLASIEGIYQNLFSNLFLCIFGFVNLICIIMLERMPVLAFGILHSLCVAY